MPSVIRGNDDFDSSHQLTLATAQNSTSGTFIDFTGIPSWVKRITVMFNGVSTSGTSVPQFQLGTSSGVTTSGYNGTGVNAVSAIVSSAYTSGFAIAASGQWAGSIVVHGQIVFSNTSGNTWVAAGQFGRSDASGGMNWTAGSVSLSATLDRVRITTVNGTDTFDAGSINILYEG